MLPGRRRKVILSSLLVGFLMLSVLARWSVAQFAEEDTMQLPMYFPTGEHLKVVDLGFNLLLADFLYLWSIQYFTGPNLFMDTEDILHVYEVITDLDPDYLDAYLTGAFIIGVLAGDVDRGLTLLDKGMQLNPREWILPYEAAFYCYTNKGDYLETLRYLEIALRIPGVKPAVKRMYAGIFAKAGQKRRAMEHWIAIYDESKSDLIRTIAQRHIFQLKVELDLETLEQAVQSYFQLFGRFPTSLHALEEDGLLEAVPVDPLERPYQYDPMTGRIWTGSEFTRAQARDANL